MRLARYVAAAAMLASAVALGAPEPRAAAETFQSLFGADLARVKATRDVKDDLELAARLVAAVKDAKSQPALMALLCEKAYELSCFIPEGQATALAAMETEAEAIPAKARGVRRPRGGDPAEAIRRGPWRGARKSGPDAHRGPSGGR